MLLPHKVYVVDTNALLNDPDVLYSFSGGEVVVPAVVLKELDSLKRRRTDRRVRYHGRKATRILFEISQNGRLVDGVALSNGSVLRVDPTEEFPDVPGDLDLKRIDDQILALAYTINRKPGVHTTLVTNDLNMLLRGEAMGLDAYRFEGKLDQLKVKEQRRTPMEWFRARGVILVLGILTVALAASTIYLYSTRTSIVQTASLPVPEDPVALQALGVSPQVLEKHYHEQLAKNPNDVKALANLADLLSHGQRYLEAVDYYRKALSQDPTNAIMRTNMGISLLRLDRYQEAIEAFRQAAVVAPNDPVIHYNLGVALAVPRVGDAQTAISELSKAIALGEQGRGNIPTAEAQNLIEQLRSRIEAQKGSASGVSSGGT